MFSSRLAPQINTTPTTNSQNSSHKFMRSRTLACHTRGKQRCSSCLGISLMALTYPRHTPRLQTSPAAYHANRATKLPHAQHTLRPALGAKPAALARSGDAAAAALEGLAPEFPAAVASETTGCTNKAALHAATRAVSPTALISQGKRPNCGERGEWKRSAITSLVKGKTVARTLFLTVAAAPY